MAGAHSLIDRVFWRKRGAGFDHLSEKAGLFVIQRNGHGCDSLLLPQYRILGSAVTEFKVTLAFRYLRRSRLRLPSLPNSEKRTALDLMMRSICEVEQLPVCSRTTFGGQPNVRLRFTKSLSLVRDRKSTRQNSSHANISYAVFCL